MVAIFLILMVAIMAAGQPDGWKMTDRFYGFRFELVGERLDSEVLELIQSEADNYACFGWVQLSKTASVVGEARCAKSRGKVFEDKIAKISNKVKDSTFLVYPDTKIRLHFSHFKILESERDTCFIDPPHQCPQYANNEKYERHSHRGDGDL